MKLIRNDYQHIKASITGMPIFRTQRRLAYAKLDAILIQSNMAEIANTEIGDFLNAQ